LLPFIRSLREIPGLMSWGLLPFLQALSFFPVCWDSAKCSKGKAYTKDSLNRLILKSLLYCQAQKGISWHFSIAYPFNMVCNPRIGHGVHKAPDQGASGKHAQGGLLL
jgi:hypothetical protein